MATVPAPRSPPHPGKSLSVLATWKSHRPIAQAELVFNGQVVADETYPDGSRDGRLEIDLPASSDGWISARLSGAHRDSFHQPVFAHTSPIYVRTGVPSPERADAARLFSEGIDRDLDRIRLKGRFYNDSQRREIEDLYRQGRQVYLDMLK